MRKLVDLDLDLDSFWRTVFGSKLSKKNVSSFNGNLYFTMNGREKNKHKNQQNRVRHRKFWCIKTSGQYIYQIIARSRKNASIDIVVPLSAHGMGGVGIMF